jgi:hypothetical protein
MSQSALGTPWAPPADDALTWFAVGGSFPAYPRPLEHTGEIYAFVYGASHALESLNFPLYQLRSRLIDGRLYFAAVPSAVAEHDLPRRLQRLADASVRYTRDLRAAWERDGRQEAETYNRWFEASPAEGSRAERASQLRRLRRARANQWFVVVRSVVAAAALLQREGKADAATADVVREALALADEGEGLFDMALLRSATTLVSNGSLAAADDAYWLEWSELCDAIEQGKRVELPIEQRRAHGLRAARRGPSPVVGPALPPDAPRMFLVREILALVAGTMAEETR